MDRKCMYVCGHTNKPRTLPIDPTSDDPFYRYKTPQLVVQVIGNGKMIRTQFNNLENVAKALKVCPAYIPHYFAHTLGAQPKYDPKRPTAERGSISGEYSFEALSNVFESFIQEFVMCTRCRLPEYRYDPSPKRITIICQSCGLKTNVDKLEIVDKFKRYVKNHPPPKSADIRPRREGDVDEQQQQQQQDSSQSSDSTSASTSVASTSSGSNEQTESSQQSSSVAQVQQQQEQQQQQVEEEDTGMSEPVSDPIMQEIANARLNSNEDFESSWSTDASAGAAAARARALLPEKLRELVVTQGSEVEEVSDSEKLRTFLGLGSPSVAQIVAEVGSIVKASHLSTADRTKLLAESLLTDLASIRKQIIKYKVVLAKFLANDTKQQSIFLTAIEDLFQGQELLDESETTRFLKQVPALLKDLYDNDIIDEEVILAWAKGSTAAGAALRKAGAAFIEWLENAEEESDDDDDDDE